MSVDDYLVALKLHKQLNEANNSDNGSLSDEVDTPAPATSIVDPEWEITDPNPDIHTLFRVFNVKFFWNKLGAVEVKWSPRMYRCAGICTYKGAAGCVVSLSLPLLKFRPRKDLVETLLHEMIHAYLFVTKNNRDRSGHGPEFCKHMDRINRDSGTRITIYHAFHDEVDHYRGHVWRCSGKCQANPPYFGYVRRATNRAPGPNDFWFAQHSAACAGTFLKVSEPDGFKAKPRKRMRTDDSDHKQIKPTADTLPRGQKDLRNFFSSSSSSGVGAAKAKVGGKFSSSVRSAKGSVGGLVKTIRGVQSRESDQGPSVVNHGGLQNNIHGFGKSEGPSGGAVRREVVPFSGKGNVLGSLSCGGGGRSRLLPDSESSSNSSASPRTPSTSTPSKDSDKFVQDLTAFDSDDGSTQSDVSEEEGGLTCPVCNCKIGGSTTLNEHLDDCGVLDRVFNSSTHSDVLSSEEEEEEEEGGGSYEKASTVLVSDSSSDDGPPGSTEPVVRPHYSPPPSPPVGCPNCPAVLTASTINQHLDRCLSFE